MQLDRPAPDFALHDLAGRLHRLSDYRGRIVIVNFWSADCPHVARTDAWMLAALARWGAEVALLSIASNENESAAEVESAARGRGLFPVLLDAGHAAADRYQAQVTPQVSVVDREGILRYHGAVDNVNLRQRHATRFFLEEAVEALLAGRLPALRETPAFGCALVRET
ncbi:MAG: Thiol-disulfide oxidoreductase ResA [Anaerolineales bacterium]|nr:Thiol-disulfide oxidoreductase ResA [Anaerolineales bacterium]